MHNGKPNTDPPGKIKHSLNIDVFTLFPGARKPPKEASSKLRVPQYLHRSASLGSEEQVPDAIPQSTIVLSQTNDNVTGTNIHHVEVLESITKTRPRGPVKRRPSTKRGRDAMRNTCSDFSFIRNSTAETCENEINVGNTNKIPSFKDELQAKLIPSIGLVTMQPQDITLEKKPSLRQTGLRQNNKEIYQVSSTQLENLMQHKRMNDAGIKLKSSDVHRPIYIPKITIGTSRTPEKGSLKSDLAQQQDGNKNDVINVKKPENLNNITTDNKSADDSNIPGNFPIRTRRTERWHEFIPHQTQQTEFQSKVTVQFNQNPADAPKIMVPSDCNPTIKDFINELITDQKSFDQAVKEGITQSRTTTNVFRRTEYVTKVSETASTKRKDFMKDVIVYDNNSNRKGNGDIVSTSATKTTEKTKDGRELHEEMLNRYTIEKKSEVNVDANSGTIINTFTKTDNMFKTTIEMSPKKTEPRKNLSNSDLLHSKDKEKDYLTIESQISGISDVTRRSSFVKTDNFASPEFIKENLSEEEEEEDVFSEKKLPPQSDILKRSTFDDDDEDLLEEEEKDRKSVITKTAAVPET